jgi:TonB-linked SusC/RagA family outer membrane protein
MKTKFNVILTLLLAFVVQISFAQEKTVTGVVTDADGIPLPGVNVSVQGKSVGTQTDFDGAYTVSAEAADKLVFEYLGFKTATVAVGNKTKIDVNLQPDVLDEVVVTGYATTSKPRATVAQQTITAKTIENRPNASFIQTLSGQVAGLSITANTGQPGGASNVNLRGVSSINGNTQPLFIIDGAPVDETNFTSLNPQEIANVTVLKDAAATAIYGNRGANGVIVVKTRGGKYNSALKINYTGIFSVQELQDNDYRLMSSPQQLTLENQLNNGIGAGLTPEEIAATPTFDWAEFFFDSGLSQNHTVNLQSGGKNATQFTSFGFNETDGILQNSDLKRFNIRNNITGKSDDDKFNYATNLSLAYSKSNEPNEIGGSGINRNYILGAYQSVPYLTPDDYTNGAELLAQGTPFRNTPLFLLDRLRTYTRFQEEMKIVGSVNASYKITDDLVFRSVSSMDYQNQMVTRAEGPESFNALLFAEPGNETPGFQQQTSRRVFSFNQVTSLNYNKIIDKHTFDAGVYTEYFKAHLRSFGYFQEGLDPRTFSPGDGAGFIDDNADNDFFVDDATALIRNAGLFSYFSQVNYDYDDRFGAQATVRRDASYRFSGSNVWATFWSVSGRWNLNNESFMQDSAINVLKLRASYGTAGNQRISGTTYFSAPDLYQSLFATGGGYGGANSIFLSQIGNNDLVWETVATANLGVDFEVWNSRLRGALDVYQRETTDLFQGTPVSAVNGTTEIDANTGTLFNTGLDLEMSYDVLQATSPDQVNLTLRMVGNYNKTELQDLPSENGEIIGTGRNGGKLFEYFVLQYAGVNPANGNLMYLDRNGDLTENPDADLDRAWIDKNIFPDFNGGFGFDLDYKNFFMTTQWNYTIGVDRFDNDLAGFQNPDNVGQFRTSTDLLRAWTPDNRVTDIPSNTAANRNTFTSNRYVTDASFLRLRFAQIGYNVPKEYLIGTGLTGARIFANGENLLTFTKWRGFDPEQLNNTGRIYPTPSTFSFGLEVSL